MSRMMESKEMGEKVENPMDPLEEEDRHSNGAAQVERRGQWEAPDGGWGWVVLGATVLVLALTLAFPSCLGIFYSDLQMAFHASNSETSWVPSIMTAVLHAGGPFCSVLVERFGCRATVMLGGVLSGVGMVASCFTNTIGELYFTAGFITGLGFCFSFQPAITILRYYFVRRRVFANAVSSTGTAIGLSILPFLSNFLRSKLGWRGSFLVLGGLLLNCCVCGAVMRPVRGAPRPAPQSLGTHAEGPPPARGRMGRVRAAMLSMLRAVRQHMAFDVFCNNRRYRYYSIGITWAMLGFVVPLVYLVPYATTNGMEKGHVALLLTVMGVINIVARPLAGILFQRPWFQGRHVYVFSVALLANGLSNSICGVAASFSVLLAYAVAFGLTMSVVGSLLFTVLMGVVEASRFPAALGLLSVMESVTLLLGPPLAGVLVDTTDQYIHVFYVCSVIVVISAIFIMVSFYWLNHTETRQAAGPHKSLPKPSLDMADCQDGGGVPLQRVEVPPGETVCANIA
ncbi:monocarboxylate transporter 6 isoform X1 [Paramormyrops kingsleyae]|uniref:Solute carrier family 16 member 5 n=2 Tax=Paramormyrops kingsleyae TaxID=1676925 RepID=A0A3B3RGH9_9TELE|nr:monocarboxylate transporter 6 isoform X1 [Paramormyrops kingsleyae]